MKLKLSVLFAFLSLQLFGQNFISSTFVKSYTKSFFFQQFGLQATYDVNLYRIKYSTTDVKGLSTVASGLVCLPNDKKTSYPLNVYHHGTVGSRLEVPSYGSFEAVLPSILTGFGFIGICPDYLGLGDSPGIHPYVHAESEASASKDMLLAAQKFISEQGFVTSKEVFISGYSQGGHAGMALHRLLEKNNLGFKLKAASHMSGPYNLSEGMKEIFLSNSEYGIVAYLANVALSYNLVYGIFKNGDLNNFFKPTYAKMVAKFAKEEINLFDMNSQMIDSLKAQFGKASPKLMIQDSIVANVIANQNHPINVALRANDVYDFKSSVPTRLFYCKNDDQVTFTNSLTAEAKMKANGTAEVQAIDVRSNATHTECVNPAATATLFFFFSYLNLVSGLDENNDILPLKVFPNPTTSIVEIVSEVELKKVTLIDIHGSIYNKTVNGNKINVEELPSGLYILQAIDLKDRSQFTRLVKH
jgi:hypothetical protein